MGFSLVLLDYAALTLVSPNFIAVIGEGPDIVDGLDALIEGVVAQDR